MSEIDPVVANTEAAAAAVPGTEVPEAAAVEEPAVEVPAVEVPAVDVSSAAVAPVAQPPAPQPSGRRLGKLRSPVGGWFLALITLGIYAAVWYYKINKELRDYDSSIVVKPGLALLSLFVPIVGLVSIYNTGKRIRQAQTIAGIAPSASGLLGLVLYFVFGLWLPYYNSNNNKVWRAAGVTA
jgi:hypothetical protein